MILYFRFLLTVLLALPKSRVTLNEEVETNWIALPTDVDPFTVTNSRYYAFMDLGRIDQLIRLGLFGHAIRYRWFPLMGSQACRFRKPIKLFSRFKILTRPVYWDDKWFFYQQKFVQNGEVKAIAYVAGLVGSPNGKISSAEVLKVLDHTSPSPPASAELQTILESLKLIDQKLQTGI